MFTLLHTNDFHNHLTDVQADYLRQLRTAVGTRGLLLDAGDAVASGNITYKPGGEMILKTMNTIGYDAVTVGNREFHFSRVGFHCKVSLAHFPVLCANVRLSRQSVADGALPALSSDGSSGSSGGEKRTDGTSTTAQQVPSHSDPPVANCIVKTLWNEKMSLRVVIFGLTVPMITERMAVRHTSPYVFDDPLITAARLVPQLHETYQPDLLVALSHIGIGQDRKLAEMVPGIDLIVGGHTHVVLEHGERVGNTLLVQGGSHGRFWGRVDILPAADASSRPQLSAALYPLPKTPEDAQMQAQIHNLETFISSESTESTLRKPSMPMYLPTFMRNTHEAENI